MKATFGAGCFWHVEEIFRKTNGVKSTQVGYSGGMKQNPTYEDVCTDTTGHAESVEIDYDPEIISYNDLLKIFWEKTRSHCPECDALIPIWLNIPVISWLLLRGKSHCCSTKISPIYPLVELLTGVNFVRITKSPYWSY